MVDSDDAMPLQSMTPHGPAWHGVGRPRIGLLRSEQSIHTDSRTHCCRTLLKLSKERKRECEPEVRHMCCLTLSHASLRRCPQLHTHKRLRAVPASSARRLGNACSGNCMAHGSCCLPLLCMESQSAYPHPLPF